MNKHSLIKEAKGYLVHDVAPNLIPNYKGKFSAVLLGLYRGHADIQICLVDDKNNLVKDFGHNVVRLGGSVMSKAASSKLSVAPGAPPVDAWFNARLMGMAKNHSEAEIEIRLIDENRETLTSIGSKRIKPGKHVTLENLEVTVNVMPRGLNQ